MSTGTSARPRYFEDVEERSTGLELFFDLVFVLCVAQLAGVLRDDPTWGTAGLLLLLFVPVWWAWVGVTFAMDRFPGDDGPTRTLVLLAGAAAAVMALAIPTVPGGGSAFFALGYAAIRLVLVVLYLRAARVSPDGGRQPRSYAVGFAVVAVLWLLSAPLPIPAQIAIWAVAMVVDVLVPVIADRRVGLLPVDRSHLPERFGSFVIIVLGETTTSAAALAADRPLTGAVVLVLAEDLAVGALLWWGFFDRGAWRRRYDALQGDRSGRLANVICAYLHFPLVAGVTVVAAGMQLAVEHASRTAGPPVALALTGGTAVYLLTMNVMTWVLRIPRAQSLAAARLLLIAVLAAIAALGAGWPVPVVVGACLAVQLAHVLVNLRRERAAPAEA